MAPKHQLSVKSILRFFGGVPAVVSACHAIGHTTCTVNTVKRWRDRRSMSLGALMMLMDAAEAAGKTLVVDEHILKGSDKNAKPQRTDAVAGHGVVESGGTARLS